ncbi:MAG: MFS transporter [Rhodoferax sp.]|nr:MFS transporter [Rhodoferax sp.]
MSHHPRARRGLVSIFGSTFLELIGYFMLMPLLLFQLKADGVPTSVAGLFAASGYLGMFLMTPFASAVTQRLGRRQTLWLAAVLPVLAAVGFWLSDALWLWFALKVLSGGAAGLRWVLAEALIAEFSPNGQRGRYVGIFETLVGFTFVIGPALLAWLGTESPLAMGWVIGFLLLGLGWSLLIPALPRAADAHSARVGLAGVWHALRAHPIIMLAGFVGGFFESGMAAILPLYGLALGLGAATAALLVSCIGLGSALTMLPAGIVADRFEQPARGRHLLMLLFAGLTLLTCCLLPLVPLAGGLIWPIVFIWGGAGGSLYTMAMIDIGTREKGITLVNSTAVLVLTYTLGGLAASSLSGALIQWSPRLGFPLALVGVAGIGLLALLRTRPQAAPG